MRVDHLMVRTVWTCGPDDALNTPAQIMWEHGVGCVVVREQGRTVGLITDRDVCLASSDERRILWSVPVRERMARDPSVIRADASAEAAEQVMRERRLKRLPVEDETGALVGLLSLNDLTRGGARLRTVKPLHVPSERAAASADPP